MCVHVDVCVCVSACEYAFHPLLPSRPPHTHTHTHTVRPPHLLHPRLKPHPPTRKMTCTPTGCPVKTSGLFFTRKNGPAQVSSLHLPPHNDHTPSREVHRAESRWENGTGGGVCHGRVRVHYAQVKSLSECLTSYQSLRGV